MPSSSRHVSAASMANWIAKSWTTPSPSLEVPFISRRSEPVPIVELFPLLRDVIGAVPAVLVLTHVSVTKAAGAERVRRLAPSPAPCTARLLKVGRRET